MTDCIFCKIIAHQVPAEFITETDRYVVIADASPKAPAHLLIIPKRHVVSLAEMPAGDQLLLGEMLFEVKHLAQKFGLAERGYKVVINCGQDGGQVVPHLHIHFLGGTRLGGLV